jgi:NitT/TauT family transport system permease protein
LVGAIIGEFVAAEEGLGFAILHAGAYLQTSLQFACFLMLAIMGISLFGIISLLQKLAMPWSLPREEIPARAAAA